MREWPLASAPTKKWSKPGGSIGTGKPTPRRAPTQSAGRFQKNIIKKRTTRLKAEGKGKDDGKR